MAITVAEQKAAERIITSYLVDHLPSQISIYAIKATRQFAYEDEFLDFVVIYEGDFKHLNPNMLNSVYDNIEPQLTANGIDHIPSIGYAPRDEWALLPGNEWALPATPTEEI